MERLFFEFAIRACLIVLTVAIVFSLLRIRSAVAQHAAWTGTLLVMLALPIWIAWGPKAALPVLPARGERAIVNEFAVAGTADVASPVPAPVESFAVPDPRPVWTWSAVSIGIYLLGVGALLFRLADGTTHIRFVAQRAGNRRGRPTTGSSALRPSARSLSAAARFHCPAFPTLRRCLEAALRGDACVALAPAG